MAVVQWLLANGLALIGAIVSLLSAALGIALIIPGPHPDQELQAAVDFLTKFSRK